MKYFEDCKVKLNKIADSVIADKSRDSLDESWLNTTRKTYLILISKFEKTCEGKKEGEIPTEVKNQLEGFLKDMATFDPIPLSDENLVNG
jgi:hypothetical protein